jgi:hypothetical protein
MVVFVGDRDWQHDTARFGMHVGHNGRMEPAYDFKLALTRVIERTRGPAVELLTLEDAARFIGQMQRWQTGAAALGFCGRAVVEGGADQEEMAHRDGNGADAACVAG